MVAHTPSAPVAPTLKDVNNVPLMRKMLTQALSDIYERLYCSFRRQVRLLVHGGAVMVLRPLFSLREGTQNVDYIYRSFVFEFRALGYPDAEQRLRICIAETACQLSLSADWTSDHVDLALPWAQECVLDSS